MAISELKNNKAAGIDEITNEDIKLIEEIKPGLILSVFSLIWQFEKCPPDFHRTIIYIS